MTELHAWLTLRYSDDDAQDALRQALVDGFHFYLLARLDLPEYIYRVWPNVLTIPAKL